MAYSVAGSGDPMRGRKIAGVLSHLSARRADGLDLRLWLTASTKYIGDPYPPYRVQITLAPICAVCGLWAASRPGSAAHGREQNHLAQRARTGQDHGQAVDSQP